MDTSRTIIRFSLPVATAFICFISLIITSPVMAVTYTVPWELAFTLKDQGTENALPTALYVDAAKKRYYMVDCSGGRLVSFDQQGAFLKIFRPEEGLDKPFDMVRLGESVLVLAEKGKNSLTRIDFASKETKNVLIKERDRQIMVDRLEIAGDKLYVLDRSSGQIFRLSTSFVVEQKFLLPEGSGGIVDFKIVGAQIWALGQQEKRIYVYQGNGLITKRVDVSEFVKFPVSLAVDDGGFVYVLDRHKAEVVVLDRKSKLKYRFLGKGHGLQHLFYPIEIRIDPLGRLCIVDEGNSRIQVFRR